MPTQTSLLWSVAASLVAVGCSCGSGTTVDDADGGGAGDSSVVSDLVSSDGEDGSFDTADAEPPPVAPPHCGDGVLDPDEECDDGNRLDGDDCDWLCRRGPGEPVDDTPDPSVGDLEPDVAWTPVGPPLPEDTSVFLPSTTLAWTGSAFATVWALVRNPSTGPFYGVGHFRLFDRRGRALATDWTYDYPDRAFSKIDLAWSGRYFGLVWNTSADDDAVGDGMVSAMILDAVGKPLIGPFSLVEGRGGCSVAASWDGEAFNGLWTCAVPTESGDHRIEIGFSRFDEMGEIQVDGAPVHSSDPSAAVVFVGEATVASSAMVTVVPAVGGATGSDELRLRWMAIGPDGGLLRPAGDLGPVDQPRVRIGWNGSRFGIPFDAASRHSADFHLAFLDGNGFLVGPPRRVCDCDWADAVAVAWGAGGWAIAYRPVPSATSDIHLVRTDAEGRLLSDTASAHPGPDGSVTLAMAFDGEGFGVLSGVLAPSFQLLFTRYVVVP